MKRTLTENSYPFKHWLTSLAVGPLILMTQDIVSGNNNLNDAVGIYFLFVVFGLFYSFPVFILYLLLFSFLIRKTDSAFIVKTVLNLITIIGGFFTIKLIGGTMMTPILASYYAVALIVCSLFYKIKEQNALKDHTLDN
jgi:hypothetical protein